MTTVEANIAMVNRLDETDLVKVERYVSRLLSKRNRKAKPELKKYTEEEFLKLLDLGILSGGLVGDAPNGEPA